MMILYWWHDKMSKQSSWPILTCPCFILWLVCLHKTLTRVKSNKFSRQFGLWYWNFCILTEKILSHMHVSLSHKKDVGQLICFLKVFTYHFMISFRVIHETRIYGRQHETWTNTNSLSLQISRFFVCSWERWMGYLHPTFNTIETHWANNFFVSAM